MSLLRFTIAASLTGLLFTGCQLEKFAPEKVAGGVSRLTVRNSAVLVSLISADEGCGFKSPQVIANAEVEGEIGSEGTVTYRVESCVLDYPTKTDVNENCTGRVITAEGRVVVAATQTVVGTLTGNPESPILPRDSDAVSMEVSANYDDFRITFSNRTTSLKQVSGQVSYKAFPHLAVSASLGICSVVTPNLTLEDIAWKDGEVVVYNGDDDFPAEVPASLYDAQLADYKGKDNWFSGSLTVWDTEVPLPEPDGDIVLDPQHEREEFWAGTECTEDLALPISYECGSIRPVQAQGVAALSVSAFGQIVGLADKECFADATPVVTGELGREGGEARWSTAGCEVSFSTTTPLSTNCNGVETSIEGHVRISGQKILRGIRTGDAEQPIVPTSRTPAFIELEIEVISPLTIAAAGASNVLTIQDGILSGSIRPQTAIDRELNVCSITTPIAAFENVSLREANVTLNAAGNTFNLVVENSLLQAQNGRDGERENYLSGTLTLEGEDFAIPTSGDPILDPDYDAEGFFETFMCTPNIELTDDSTDCADAFYGELGVNAARLVAQTVGTVTGLINRDGDCGFDRIWEKIFPDTVIGDVGDQGYMVWSVQDCNLGSASQSVYSTNCTGDTTYLDGFAQIDATRKVSGERERAYLLLPSIRPNFHEALEVTLDTVILNEFVTFTVPAGESEPPGKMTIHDGTLTGTVIPILGERQDEEGTYDIPTPVARMNTIALNGADVTLQSGPKTFKLSLNDVLLDGSNGYFQGRGNELSGSMVINGTPITFGDVLNPSFEQGSFDQGYICAEDLRELIAPD